METPTPPNPPDSSTSPSSGPLTRLWPPPFFKTEEGRKLLAAQRVRSSRRLKHESEVELFKGKNGDLELVREKLGLRPVQMTELLMVHPSAWTRWTKLSKKAPPHIYRMLEWYLELQAWRTQGRQAMAPQSFQLPEFSKSFSAPKIDKAENIRGPVLNRRILLLGILLVGFILGRILPL